MNQFYRIVSGVLLAGALWAGYTAWRARIPAAVASAAHRPAAPDFTLPDARGAELRWSDFQGQVVLLNFWETSCAPCRLEIPWFIEFQRRYAKRGFSVVGVSIDADGWQSVRPFVAAKKINYPMVVDGGEVEHRYGGLEAIPTTFLIDRSGRIAATHVGVIPKADYEAEIQTLLAER